MNRQIRVPEVRVIDPDGKQIGIMETFKALEMAEEMGLDLVEVSPTARPPVCRIMDFGKYKYEQSKRLRQAKKKQHVIHVKEIKLRPKTEEHDYQFKKRHAENFLEKNNKVKFTVVFRGRELAHKDLGQRILERMRDDLAEFGTVERPIEFEGRLMTMVVAPLAQKHRETAKKAERRQGTPEEKKDAEDKVEQGREEEIQDDF